MKKKTDEQTEDLHKQIEEWKAKYLRAIADYQNLEKRKQEEIDEVRRVAADRLLKRILPVVDSFERAQNHLHDPGLSLALKELTAFLVEHGVQKLDVLGKTFNPEEMEGIEVVTGDDTIVVEEILPGYTLHGTVIRVAQVKVGRANPTNE